MVLNKQYKKKKKKNIYILYILVLVPGTGYQESTKEFE